MEIFNIFFDRCLPDIYKIKQIFCGSCDIIEEFLLCYSSLITRPFFWLHVFWVMIVWCDTWETIVLQVKSSNEKTIAICSKKIIYPKHIQFETTLGTDSDCREISLTLIHNLGWNVCRKVQVLDKALYHLEMFEYWNHIKELINFDDSYLNGKQWYKHCSCDSKYHILTVPNGDISPNWFLLPLTICNPWWSNCPGRFVAAFVAHSGINILSQNHVTDLTFHIWQLAWLL